MLEKLSFFRNREGLLEAYLESNRTSTMKLFMGKKLTAKNYFRKKAPSWMFDLFLKTPLCITTNWGKQKQHPRGVRTCSKVFWKYGANLQENTHAKGWFLETRGSYRSTIWVMLIVRYWNFWGPTVRCY